MRASSLGSIIAVIVAATAAACSATNGTHATQGGAGAAESGVSSSGTPGAGGAASSGSTAGSGLSGTSTSTSSGGPSMLSAYAHTDTTLYKLDPSQTPLAITKIGDFDCIGNSGNEDHSMTDLAVNEAGDLWGVSEYNVYKLTLPAHETGTVHCATTIQLNSPSGVFYGLTFAPAGVLDPVNEVLVASNTAGALYAVDASGNLTQHGTFGVVPAHDGHGNTYPNAGKAWELSGDIVFLANNGNPVGFATVRDCQDPPYGSNSTCDTTDTLLEIDMNAFKTAGTQSITKSIRGQVVKSSSCNDRNNASYGSMYGIAAYQGNVFGFSNNGFIVTIDNNDGTACLALSTPGDFWAGAAITTGAPVIVPITH